jgi:hypothetical protein
MLKKLIALAVFAIMSLQAENRVFELRTYISKEGKLDNVLARFRDHTTKLFEKHGMQNIGYWVAADAPASQNTLIYIVAHKNRDAAKASWDAFRKDPEWIKAKDASEAQGAIVDKVTSVFMNPTDFSKLK